MAYSWDAATTTWSQIGEVVGAAGGGGGGGGVTGGFTFDVDVADGAPARKLAYDGVSNPYDVAEAWLAQEGLPAAYKEQIVQFLISNTGGAGGAAATALAGAGAANYDPFTGGGAYVPPPPAARAPPAPQPRRLAFAPVTQPVVFESNAGGLAAMAAKLGGLMEQHGVAQEAREELGGLLAALQATPPATAGSRLSPSSAAAVLALPDADLFPVFDLLRALAIAPGAPLADLAAADEGGGLRALEEALRRAAAPGAPSPMLTTALRLLCTALAPAAPAPLRAWARRLAAPEGSNSAPGLLEALARAAPQHGAKGVRAAFASLLLSLAAVHVREPAGEAGFDRAALLGTVLAAQLDAPEEDWEPHARLASAAATLCLGDARACALARTLGADEVAAALQGRCGGGAAAAAAKGAEQGKAYEAAADLLQILSDANVAAV